MSTEAAAASTTDTSKRPSAVARFAPHVVRVLLGLIFFVFGLNGFFNFIPPPKDAMPEAVMAFSGALMKTGYMFPVIKAVETLSGALLLANRFVALALTLLAPIIINITLFHFVLAKSGYPMIIAILAFEIYLAWVHRAAYRGLFMPKPPAA